MGAENPPSQGLDLGASFGREAQWQRRTSGALHYLESNLELFSYWRLEVRVQLAEQLTFRALDCWLALGFPV